MMTIVSGNRFRIAATLASLLALSAVAETLATTQDIGAIAVFINEGHIKIQVDVVSKDKKDKTILPLHPGQMERTFFAGGHVELYTASKDIVSGRLLFTRSLPTPMSAPEFMEKGTRTFYFRVAGRKIFLVKPMDLTSKERRWLKERTKEGW